MNREEKLKMGMNILVKEEKCICNKLTSEDWQKEQLKHGVYWTYPIV